MHEPRSSTAAPSYGIEPIGCSLLASALVAFLVVVPAPLAAQPSCEALPSNPIDNCGFENGDPPAGWQVHSGLDFRQETEAYSGRYSGGTTPQSGVIPGDFRSALVSNCFPVRSGSVYDFGARFQITDSSGSFCRLLVRSYADANCTEQSGSISSGSLALPSSRWVLIDATGTPDGQSAQLTLSCQTWAQNARLFTDDVLAIPRPTVLDIPSASALGLTALSALLLVSGFLLIRQGRS